MSLESLLEALSMLRISFGRLVYFSLAFSVQSNCCSFVQLLVLFVRSILNLIRNPLTSVVQVSDYHC